MKSKEYETILLILKRVAGFLLKLVARAEKGEEI